MKHITIVLMAIMVSLAAKGQHHEETVKKEIVFPEGKNAVLIVENIFGDIQVDGYSGDRVILEIETEFNADTQKELEEAMKKVYLAFETRADTVDVFLDGICGCHREKSRNYNWNQCDFHFRHDFKVKVPARANIKVSTVNDGEVEVQNISGEVVARNVNGGITVEGISGPADIHTINGEVEVRYAKNPSEKSSYYSLNGDVNVYYDAGLSADMQFKSFQGDMFTNFDVSEWLAPVIKTSKSKSKNRAHYRIENKTAVRIGKGGVILDFETFNGDVYVRKI